MELFKECQLKIIPSNLIDRLANCIIGAKNEKAQKIRESNSDKIRMKYIKLQTFQLIVKSDVPIIVVTPGARNGQEQR